MTKTGVLGVEEEELDRLPAALKQLQTQLVTTSCVA